MGQGSGVAVSCAVGCRHGSDPTWLWLWCRLAAVAPIRLPSLGTSICHRCGPKKQKSLLARLWGTGFLTHCQGRPWCDPSRVACDLAASITNADIPFAPTIPLLGFYHVGKLIYTVTAAVARSVKTIRNIPSAIDRAVLKQITVLVAT